MGEYREAAQRIAGILAQREGIRAKDIPELIGGHWWNGEINCYPGYPTNRCHHIAFFVSLNSSKNAKGSGHLHFQKMVETLVQHMQGRCQGITRVAVVITDSWDARILEKWERNIEQIKRQAHLELYIVAAGQAVELPI